MTFELTSDDAGGYRAAPESPSRTVLLVEDNEDNRIVYRTILTHFGYRVLEAVDGAQAVDLARASLPDAILMDVSLPVMDGWEATRLLKANHETRRIPIIALTAHALASDRAHAISVGCDDYLAKPCPPRDVLGAIERVLGAGRSD